MIDFAKTTITGGESVSDGKQYPEREDGQYKYKFSCLLFYPLVKFNLPSSLEPFFSINGGGFMLFCYGYQFLILQDEFGTLFP